MLPKRTRLTTHQFTDLFQAGRRIHTPYFQIIIGSPGQFQAAVVVGKKVYRHAVDRNRVRRQLYTVLRHWQQATGYDTAIIVVVKPKLTTIPATERAAALQAALDTLQA